MKQRQTPRTRKKQFYTVKKPVVELSSLAPVQALRLRPSRTFRGAVTEPGPMVSDGKIIFCIDHLPPESKQMAERMAGRRDPRRRRWVAQPEAERLFRKIIGGATRKARVLGQMGRPGWVRASSVEHMAILRCGRGGGQRYVFIDAHRLLLLRQITQADEILCGLPGEPVLLRRKGLPVGGITALRVAPDVQ